MKEERDQFIKLLKIAVQKVPKNKPLAVVYSGGLDSSLVAFTAHQIGLKITAFTVGFPDSPDYQFVDQIKTKLPFPAKLIELDQETLKENLPLARKLIARAELEPNLMQLSLGLATSLTFEAIRRADFEEALSGQAADELFAGYHRALELKESEINANCRKELARLQLADAKREEAIAAHFDLRIDYPYLDPDLVEFGLNLDPNLKLRKKEGELGRKYLLRQAAAYLGLPDKIVNRPKQAFQYSSRVQRELIKILKRE